MEKDKIVFKGSHPDSLYRVQPNSESRVDKMARLLRILRWPMALIVVCIALALFVYFLMPDNIDSVDSANDTYWEPVTAGHTYNPVTDEQTIMPHRTRPPGYKHRTYTKAPVTTYNPGTKTPEIDFYDTENDKNAELTSIIDTITETSPNRVLPIKPVFPAHIAPEVQYGNEKADADKLRTPKVLEEGSTLPDESTLKPHITQKPEKPLAVYFKDLSQATTTTTEAITRAETVNQFANYGDKQTTKKVEISTKSHPTAYKDYHTPLLKVKPQNIKQYLVTETPEAPPEAPPEIDAYYGSRPKGGVNFTSGHSNLFGISIEDAAKMRSTTQSSLYNTRVSPTLPTWRDGDDTTKKYPVSVNYEVPQCRSTRLPLCSEILPYDLAGSPATIGGVVATSLLSQIEYLVATNCSERVRHFTCALLEPECNPPPYPPKMPCFNLCKAIMDGCEDQIPRELAAAFDCQQYSRTNCVAAKPPCFARELTCGDGSCIPRDWVCDGNKDCPHGEDEAVCTKCKRNEFRCSSGGCILRQWLCDGYSDCPEGEDEGESCENERHEADELGEESAGSAPAPVVRRPNKIPTKAKAGDSHRTGESHNSEELLVTSDSNNAFKRNFTRRPSLSRLTPYARSTAAPVKHKSDEKDFESTKKIEGRKIEGGNIENTETAQNATEIDDSLEDVNVGDLGFFEDLKKTKEQNPRTNEQKPPMKTKFTTGEGPRLSPSTPMTKLDKSIDKLERVIDGASLLKKVKAEIGEDNLYSTETNNTSIEKFDDIPLTAPNTSRAGNSRGQGSKSAHASPCPSGELRCVDGRCITLAQLCDGTIDCSDHADEDNCYT